MGLLYLAVWLGTSLVPLRLAEADNRVLIIGIDGAGGSYLPAVSTPAIDRLAFDGVASYQSLNEGALVASPPSGYGASGVNWTTIVTGMSAAHHGIVDNSFAGYDPSAAPHFFTAVKQFDPSLFTASIVNWSPINQQLLTNADLALEYDCCSASAEDAQLTADTMNLLRSGDPHAVFLHFEQVDAAGHGNGWGGAAYQQAIRNVDAHIGDIVQAVKTRPGYISGEENWLIMVTADHGGIGTSHSAGQGPVNWKVPIILSGSTFPDNSVLVPGTLRDLAPTALVHLGVAPHTLQLDGGAIGTPGQFLPSGADLNGDHLVNADDFTWFKNHLDDDLAKLDVTQRYAAGDLNNDGLHSPADFALFSQQYQYAWANFRGKVAPPFRAEEIPEPSAFMMLGFAFLVFLRRRR
ncbi:MAG: alkaline phosphatase family protein [Pirellulaceae bacterium]